MQKWTVWGLYSSPIFSSINNKNLQPKSCIVKRFSINCDNQAIVKAISGFALLLTSCFVWSNDFKTGMAAYENGNYKVALTVFQHSANQFHPDVQYRLGIMYADGQGVDKDLEQAVVWYHKAAVQDHSAAQNKLGWMYENGQGVQKSLKQAIAWYSKAAEQDNADAQYNLGWMYENGQGLDKSAHQAVFWYRKAAEQGHAFAQYDLGWMYKDGLGVEKSLKQAVFWFRKAAEQGDSDSQYSLGWMYENGQGVEKSNQQAMDWYSKAAAQDHKDAAKKISNFQQATTCNSMATTKLFGEFILCVNRTTLRQKISKENVSVISEQDTNWGDTYNSSHILSGSSELFVEYTADNQGVSFARYTFPGLMDTQLVSRVKTFVERKYGTPQHSIGNVNLGKVKYRWELNDGIELVVHRNWPDTSTYLTFMHPTNYKVTQAEKNKQKEEMKAAIYDKQSNAF